MPRGDFRSVYLPYCLQKLEDGRYVVLNRAYKPLGFLSQEHVVYEEFPIAAEIKGIGPAVAAKLSWKGDTDVDRIYLYNDGTNPVSSEANMDAYLDKLRILAKLKLKPIP